MPRDIITVGNEAVIMPNPELFTLISSFIGADFDNLNRKILFTEITNCTTENGIRFAMFTETVIDITSSLTDIFSTIDNVGD